MSLKLENVQKSWPYLTLRASFEVRPGERLAIVGPSGMGKSSLLRLIAGLERLEDFGTGRNSGRIFLGGRDMTRLAPQARKVGFLFQDQALFSGMSVIENVAFGLKLRGVKRAEREARAIRWLEKLHLRDQVKTSIDALSGGERQRVALARALIIEPELLLLDEPFTGLDSELKKDLISQLLLLLQDRPIPTVIISHDEADVKSFATRSLRVRDENGIRVVGEL
jgi:putative spermidine/putrescine transport system ATP-binding protein